jgi:hypothetical protein
LAVISGNIGDDITSANNVATFVESGKTVASPVNYKVTGIKRPNRKMKTPDLLSPSVWCYTGTGSQLAVYRQIANLP